MSAEAQSSTALVATAASKRRRSSGSTLASPSSLSPEAKKENGDSKNDVDSNQKLEDQVACQHDEEKEKIRRNWWRARRL
eukprot:133993-Lingulodinium_polyedra.AAC.2